MIYLHELELDTLSNFNDISMACFSVGSWCLTRAYDKYDETTDIMMYIIFGILAFGIGVYFRWRKKGITDKIKKESKTINS